MRSALATALLLGACGAGGPMGPPEVVLGGGTAAFEPLADGDTVFIVQGPQGGFHVWGSVRASNLDPGNPDDLQDPSNPTTEFRVFTGGERVDAGVSRYVQGLDAANSGVYEMIGRTVILDILADDELAGAEIRVTVEITAATGESGSDERVLIAAPHPNNP